MSRKRGFDLAEARSKLPWFVAQPDPSVYLGNDYIVVDFETTTIKKGRPLLTENDIVLAVWSRGGKSYAKWGGVYAQQELVAACEQAKFIVAHNAKFELQWLARCGLDIGNVLVYDTMLGEYVLGGNRWRWAQCSLENSAQRRLGEGKIPVMSAMYNGGMCSRDIPESWLLRYCLRDVQVTERLFHKQRELLQELDQLSIAYTRNLLVPVLADIERNGMTLDADKVDDLVRTREEEYREVTHRLAEIVGDVNTNSGPQLAVFLYETMGFALPTDHRGRPVVTASGRPPTDQDSVAGLKPRTKAQREFLELYKRSKALHNELSKYLRKFSDCCRENKGILGASFNQTNTATHRLSSSGTDYSTQFQNFPRAYKPVFKARNEGWLVGEGDGAQLEFRVAAHLGRDEQALEDCRTGADIHKFTASVLNNCTEEEVTKEQRQAAKADTFKPLYGGQSGTPAQQRYYEAFRKKYHGISDTQQAWINEVLRTKVLITEWGMRYYFPDTTMSRSGYVSNTTSICNYPVQALATAEIIPVALVYFWHLVRTSGLKMFIVNTVHDSIICELPPEEVEAFHELCKFCLTEQTDVYLKEVYNLTFLAPLGCGVSTATHWSTGEEHTYEKDTAYD